MSFVDTEIHDQIMVIRLNRPERLNALSRAVREGMGEAFTEFNKSDSLEVAILNGKPLVFQLGGKEWEKAMDALGFTATLTERGVGDLGLAVDSEEKRKLILDTLSELFATGERDQWIEILRGVDIVSAPINTLLEASNDPNVLANGYISEMDYPEHNKTVKVHGSPWQFYETPSRIGVAPKLGEHNKEILKTLGYDDAAIAGLLARQVI